MNIGKNNSTRAPKAAHKSTNISRRNKKNLQAHFSLNIKHNRAKNSGEQVEVREKYLSKDSHGA